jgi:Fic family protein
MKYPSRPPVLIKLLSDTIAKGPDRLTQIMALAQEERYLQQYYHWDKLQHITPPTGFSHEELWLSLKFARNGTLRQIPLTDLKGDKFQFCLPELVQQALHQIDIGAGGAIGVPEPITNPQTKDRYLMRSLMEEAITSSQLEGAVTTREVAKEMIRTGRAPRDKSEQMILNNFVTMQRITELKSEELTPEMIFAIHRLVTEKTMQNPTAVGRFRSSDEKVVVSDEFTGEVFHDPPPADELETRLAAMCDFANSKTPAFFVHPVVRAIILHFWLAYDHPFVDGNGRTARALFYWSMLHHGCWLFEFVSISSILRKGPAKYARSFLYTETDANDLTYFIVAQTNVIKRAIQELHAYIDKQTVEIRELESHVRALNLFNHRQANLIRHALKHPYQDYTFGSHQKSNLIAYQTARTDLFDLHSRGVLEQEKRGRQLIFTVPGDLSERLRKLDKKRK